jgi:hypothetical protein
LSTSTTIFSPSPAGLYGGTGRIVSDPSRLGGTLKAADSFGYMLLSNSPTR